MFADQNRMFLGGFLTENQPDTRLRHAFWEAKNDDYRFLVGQYWDLTSPLLPNTANFSVSWGGGQHRFPPSPVPR